MFSTLLRPRREPLARMRALPRTEAAPAVARRIGVWPWLYLPLLPLTAMLPFLITTPVGDYRALQSVEAFRNLPLFWALYSVWLTLLLVLLWRAPNRGVVAMLVGLFAVTSMGVYVLATPHGQGEDWLWAIDPIQIQRLGRIENLGYYDFPALAIMRVYFAEISGVDVAQFRTPMVLLWLVALSQLLLTGYFRLFRSPRLAGLAVIVALQSNLVLARFYLHPMYAGVLLVAALMGFLLGRDRPLTIGERIVIILLLGGLTTTHFVSSMVGLSIIIGLYAEQRWRRGPEVVSRGMVVLACTLAAFWATYWTAATFENLVSLLPDVGDQYKQREGLYYVGRVAAANTEGLPLWVTGVQGFWWGSVYLGGGLLALATLARRRRLPMAPGYAGAYVVLAVTAVAGMVISKGGYDFYRFIVYGSLIAAPLVLHWLLGQRLRGLRVVALSAMLIALAVPTMLAHNTSVGTQATQRSEIGAARFLARSVPEGPNENIRLYGPLRTVAYYRPDLIPHEVTFPRQAADIRSIDELRGHWDEYLGNFIREGEQGKKTLLTFDKRDIIYWRHIFGLPEDDPLWSRVRERYLKQADRVFDAGRTQVYRSGLAPPRVERPVAPVLEGVDLLP